MVTRAALDARRRTSLSEKARKLKTSRSELSLGGNNDEDEASKKLRKKWRNVSLICATVLILFFSLGTFFLRAYDPTFTTNFDAFYFTVITMTTIGFGDFYPTNQKTKLFVVCFTFLGLIMLTGAIGALVDYSMYLQAQMKVKLRVMQLDRENDEGGDDDDDEEDEDEISSIKGKSMGSLHMRSSSPQRTPTGYGAGDANTRRGRRGGMAQVGSQLSIADIYNLSKKQRFWVDRMGVPVFAVDIIQELLLSTAFIIINLGIGVLFYAVLVDDYNVVDALYLSAMTVTTVGFGDVSPTNKSSRIFTIFYGVFGTLLTAKALTTFNSAIQKYKKAFQDDAILTSKMSIADFISMDDDHSGEVSKAEFMLYKIIHMNLVHPDVIERIEKQFNNIDKDMNGMITIDEIKDTYSNVFLKMRSRESHSDKDEAIVRPPVHPSRVVPSYNRAESGGSVGSFSGRSLSNMARNILDRISPRHNQSSSESRVSSHRQKGDGERSGRSELWGWSRREEEDSEEDDFGDIVSGNFDDVHHFPSSIQESPLHAQEVGTGAAQKFFGEEKSDAKNLKVTMSMSAVELADEA